MVADSAGPRAQERSCPLEGAPGSLAIAFGEQALRWGGLLVNTAMVFGYFIHDSREQRRDRAFWILCLTLLMIHFTACEIVITNAHEWKPVWFMVMVPELAIFLALRN